MRIVFENCAIVDAQAEQARAGHHVLVEDGRIREVSDQAIKADGAVRLDVGGRTLMPGLIDAHVHVTISEVAIARMESSPLTLMTAEAAAIMRGMLDRGFTTVRDCAGADWGLAQAVERGLLAGPRLFIAGRALSQTGGHGDFRRRTQGVEPCACSNALSAITRIADGVPEVRKAARDELRKGADQIKVMVSGGVLSPNDPLENTQYSPEGADRHRRGGGRLEHLCRRPRLHACVDPPRDGLRRAHHRAWKLAGPRGGPGDEGRRRLSGADAGDL